jgi:hypothetical protein
LGDGAAPVGPGRDQTGKAAVELVVFLVAVGPFNGDHRRDDEDKKL